MQLVNSIFCHMVTLW